MSQNQSSRWQSLKLFWLAVVVWLLALGLTVWFDDEIRVALWLGALGWWLLLDLVGGLLILIAGFRAFKVPAARRWRSLGGALILVGTLAAWHLAGNHWVHVVRFQINRSYYERRLAQIEAIPAAQRADHLEPDCRIEPGPPLRVAFVLPGGILDNFTAIVHDPTGSVQRINSIRTHRAFWQDPSFAVIRHCFGGDLVITEALGGGWYRCSFT